MLNASIIEITQGKFWSIVGGCNAVAALLAESVALDVDPERTLAVADPDVAAEPAPLSVRDTPVGAIVVEGRTMPDGPKVIVVPSISVVTKDWRAPAPMLYVVPLMMACDESMEKTRSPIVVTT